MTKLQTIFKSLLSPYSQDSKYWSEVEEAHTSKERHYHNLSHLEDIYHRLEPLKSEIDDWEAVLFSLFYHDIVYHSVKKNNEAQSTKLAVKRMQELGVTQPTIHLTNEMILATAGHSVSEVRDINFFTDADLAILGSDWKKYEMYFQGVRKEYSIYPDLLYKPGRRKVLNHFLNLKSIYKTDYFKSRLEEKARENIGKELSILSK